MFYNDVYYVYTYTYYFLFSKNQVGRQRSGRGVHTGWALENDKFIHYVVVISKFSCNVLLHTDF